jgi:hypothetical protein
MLVYQRVYETSTWGLMFIVNRSYVDCLHTLFLGLFVWVMR